MRRFLPALLLPLAACAAQGTPDFLSPQDQLRPSAMIAPALLGDTARYAGNPAGAARAAALMEVLAVGFRNDPVYTSDVQGAWLSQVMIGQGEMRHALGIVPDARGSAVIVQLREAAAALDAGDRAKAEAALAAPIFPAGGAATLERLAGLPHLPRVSEAGQAATTAFRLMDRRP